MNDPIHSPRNDQTPGDALHEEAGIWLRCLTSGEARQVDLQAFKRWQRTSAAHVAAFEDAKRQWHATRPALGHLLRNDATIAARHQRLLHGASMGRRAFLGTALGATAAAGLALAYPPFGWWPAVDQWDADYTTATGEHREIAAADHINLTLNTGTRVRRQPPDSREAMGIDLLAGEVAVDMDGGGQLFVVAAGAGRMLSRSGRFQVRKLDGRVCVSCIAGQVSLEHPRASRQLQARQQIWYDSESVAAALPIEPDDVTAWRRGQLLFRQTPLAQAIDEINRYRAGRVILTDQSKSNRLVSGRFQIAGLDEALLQIQHTFELQARSLPGGMLLLS